MDATVAVERTLGLKAVIAFQVLGGIIIAGMGLGILAGVVPLTINNELAAPTSTMALFTIALLLFLAFLVFGLAWGLWNYKSWARIIASVLAVPDLFVFPVGTVLGAAILYVLWKEEPTKTLFD